MGIAALWAAGSAPLAAQYAPPVAPYAAPAPEYATPAPQYGSTGVPVDPYAGPSYARPHYGPPGEAPPPYYGGQHYGGQHYGGQHYGPPYYQAVPQTAAGPAFASNRFEEELPPPSAGGEDYLSGGSQAPSSSWVIPGLPGEFHAGCAECGNGGGRGFDDEYFDYDETCGPGDPCVPKRKFTDLGLGALSLPFATFELDTARPSNYYRLRLDSVNHWTEPDRLEYLMARQGGGIGKGPAIVDSYVNFVDTRIGFEAGGDKIGVLTEMTIRALDSEFNSNNVGLGDMTVAPKVMILDEGHFQVTQITRIVILTGYFRRGLGTGHMSMEPGFLANYKLSCTTYLHGEFKYWFPIAGDIEYSGGMFRYGAGISHLLYERPHQDFAVIPVIEMVGFTLLDGGASIPSGGFRSVGPEAIVNLMPGVRVLVAEGAEVGLQMGFPITTTRFYDGMLRAEFRMNY